MKDEWPRCSVPGCDNTVNPMRIALELTTCIELHGAVKKTYVVIPVPKSNGVVGSRDDLIGVSGSHKGSTMSSMVGSSNETPRAYVRPPQPGRVFREAVDGSQAEADGGGVQPETRGISSLCARRIILCEPRQGGLYWTSDNGGLPEAHRLGLVTSKSTPSRLTPRGELAYQMLKQGKPVSIEKLKEYS